MIQNNSYIYTAGYNDGKHFKPFRKASSRLKQRTYTHAYFMALSDTAARGMIWRAIVHHYIAVALPDVYASLNGDYGLSPRRNKNKFVSVCIMAYTKYLSLYSKTES